MVIRMKCWKREDAEEVLDLEVRCKGVCLWEMPTCTTMQIHFFQESKLY